MKTKYHFISCVISKYIYIYMCKNCHMLSLTKNIYL